VQDGPGDWHQLPYGDNDGGQTLVGTDGVYYYQNDSVWRRKRNGVVDFPAGLRDADFIAVSPADPARILVRHGAKLYESHDLGDSIPDDLTPNGAIDNVSAIAYGTNNVDGTKNVYAAYAGTSMGPLFGLFVRFAAGEGFARAQGYPEGAQVDAIALDRTDWRRAAIISDDGKVLYTMDGGTHFADIRANVGDILRFMRKIELVRAGADVVILIGGDPQLGHGAVVHTIIPDRTPAPNVDWTEFGTGLPHANIFDLHYYPPSPFGTAAWEGTSCSLAASAAAPG